MSQHETQDTLPPSMDPHEGGAMDAPTRLFGILKKLGPGLIIAGSIVGSGELIATTKTGAQAGISLLWLIVIGCIIKVFVQIELGRYTISQGETTLTALDRVPGPRLRANWIVWFWLAMALLGLGQLGGIVGGVGQSLALSLPIKGDYARAIQMPSVGELRQYLKGHEPLLSEWDLRLYLTWGDSMAATDPDDADPPTVFGTLDEDAVQWVRSVVPATGERLRELDEQDGRGGQLIAATERLIEWETTADAPDGEEGITVSPVLAAVRTAPQERDAARRALQELLNETNLAYLEQLSEQGTEDDDPLAALARLDEPQRERLLRGHGILSRQLAELDADDHRATRAMGAVIRLVEAQDRVREAVAREADAVELAKLKAEAGYRKQLADILIEPATTDDKFWALGVTLVTMALLFFGRYGMIQCISTALVVAFTFITIGNVLALQSTVQWHISADQFLYGLSFHLPEAGTVNPLLTALATFGIIGVGASELIAYPYWCLEKGYAKFTGPRSSDPDWERRARGWIRVMQYDTFLSMVVYTIATLAFFLMGVAVLYNEGRDPDGMRMVSTLARAYVPVFGEYSGWLFLGGAVAVLYSTFLVANAGLARVMTDALKVFGLMQRGRQRSHDVALGTLSLVLPMIALSTFWAGVNPVKAILLAGTMQALLLPMIGIGSLYLRYTRIDPRLQPGPVWDGLLVLSCLGLLVAGAWGGYSQVLDLIAQLRAV